MPLVKRRLKPKLSNFFSSSVYHPVDDKDQIEFNTFPSTIYTSVPQNYFFASGQNMNANIGCRREKREFDCMGPHGIKIRNSKEIEVLNLLTMHNMFASSTFFLHKNYTTWKSFNGKNTPYHLDQWISNSMNHIKDSKVVNFGIPSDFSAIQFSLKFKNSKNNNCIDRDVIDWNIFLDEDFKNSYNEELSNEMKDITFEQENKMTYSQFSKAIIRAANKTALSPEEKSKGWYNYSKNIIQPLVDKRSEVLNSIRQKTFSDEDAISFAREARKN